MELNNWSMCTYESLLQRAPGRYATLKPPLKYFKVKITRRLSPLHLLLDVISTFCPYCFYFENKAIRIRLNILGCDTGGCD